MVLGARKSLFVLALSCLVALLTGLPMLEVGRSRARNASLVYHGYYEVFDLFISDVFEDELRSDPRGLDWSSNSAHIANAATRSNLVAVPHAVEDPQAYLYDPAYLESCAENGLDVILYVHTLSKYVYFFDPRPCTNEDRMELLLEHFSIYEERFREYRNQIIAVQIYDEPWVEPHNVTRDMLYDMAEAARQVFWGKPIMVMFHRQGNTYQYTHPNGTIITYDDWVGSTPEAFDILGVDPFFYSYHDEQWPDYHQTGDKGMVESDVSWACAFGKPVILAGQAYDPGASMFFDRDNVDTRLEIYDGFEGWTSGRPDDGRWSAGPGVEATDSLSRAGSKSLLIWSPDGAASAALEFQRVHSVDVSFDLAVDSVGSPLAWFLLGDDAGDPVRLGIGGRDLLIDDGTRVQIINRSIDIEPGKWHSIRISANVDANRWSMWIDGDIQTRLPNAVLPSSFTHLMLLSSEDSSRIWIDELRIERYWSQIPLNEKETRLYYEAAIRHPEVVGLMWWNYPHSFASSLVGEEGAGLQVTNVWEVQRQIWELIG